MNHYTDPASGRQYYVDPVTGQTRWTDDLSVFTQRSKPKSAHKGASMWKLVVASGVLLVVGVGIGSTLSSGSPATTSVTSPSPSVSSAVVSSVKPKPLAVGGDGTYLVGSDIQPGTYKSPGADLCYWARLKSTDGGVEAIIANHAGAGAQVVTIKKTDKAFETAGCGTWTKIS